MITTTFLTKFIYDVIKSLQDYLHTDERGRNLYMRNVINPNYLQVYPEEYENLTEEETLLINNFLECFKDPSNLQKVFNIPLYSGSIVKVKNISGENDDERCIGADDYVYDPDDKENYIFVSELDSNIKYTYEKSLYYNSDFEDEEEDDEEEEEDDYNSDFEDEEDEEDEEKYKKKFTINDLLVAYISVRHSKYDRFYEVFDSVIVTEKEDELFINIDFNHRS
jgi:hypothetical protein